MPPQEDTTQPPMLPTEPVPEPLPPQAPVPPPAPAPEAAEPLPATSPPLPNIPPNRVTNPPPSMPTSETVGTSDPPGTSAKHLKPVNPKLSSLFEHDADEVLIGQLNKHPVGLIFIYSGAFTMFLALMMIVYFIFRLAPESGFDISSYGIWIKALFGLVGFFILLGGYVAGWVYQRSALVLTTEKLVQLTQRNLFDRKVSQLAIGDVQDVTVDQTGILSRMFGYGSINIETAGEQYNYSFDYAPYPHEASKEIVAAHERNVQLYGN